MYAPAIARLLRSMGLLAAFACAAPLLAAPCQPGETELNGRCVSAAEAAAELRAAAEARRQAAKQKAGESTEPGSPSRDFSFRREPQPTAAGGASAASPARPAAARARRLTPSRTYLRAADIPPAGVGAYGIVALNGRPTEASRARLLRFCTAFVNHLPRQDALPASVKVSDQMVTIWPLDDPAGPAAKADDCRHVTDHYDLYGGLSAIEDANRQGAALTGRGPFLIGWSPSSSRGVPDRVVLIYDMSGYESQDSFDRAFIWWQQKVIADPAMWRSGWSLEKVRLSVRDFFDSNAESALKAINIFSGGK